MLTPTSRLFAENLKRLRLDRGWSQPQLAARAQTSAATISRIEKGHSGTTLELGGMIAAAFGTTLAAMVTPRPGQAEREAA